MHIITPSVGGGITHVNIKKVYMICVHLVFPPVPSHNFLMYTVFRPCGADQAGQSEGAVCGG